MTRRWFASMVVVVLLAAGCATAPSPTSDAAPSELPSPGEGTAVSLGEGTRPLDARAYVLEAREALAVRNYRKAAESARAAGEIDPDIPEARIVEAKAREAMGDLAGALPLWQGLVRDRQGGEESLFRYASLAVRRGEGLRALGLLRDRIADEPGDPELDGVSGWIALALGRWSDAREHLEATWHTPAASRYALYLGRVRLLEGDLSGARQAAEVAVGTGEDAGAWVLLGDVRRSQGLAAGAEMAYRRALEVDPTHYPAGVNLGVLRLSQGRVSDAAALFASATESRPDGPHAWNNLGLARRTQGDLDGAQAAYEKALAVYPGFSPALKNLGILNEKYLGRPAGALPYYDRYLEAHPEDEKVARWRKTAERLAKEETQP